jgi:hypothetical protein
MLPNGITPFFGNEKESSHPKKWRLAFGGEGGVTGLYHLIERGTLMTTVTSDILALVIYHLFQ